MAKLASIRVRLDSKAGDETINYDAEVTVTSQGIFSIQLPDPLQDILGEFAKQALKDHPSSFVRNTKHSVISARTLQDAQHGVTTLLEAYLTVEVVEDIVIAYRADTAYAVYRRPDGTLHPNGCGDTPVPGRQLGEGKWHGNINPSHTSPVFSMGLAARVYKRTTYIRAAGRKEKFTYPLDKDLGHHGTYLNRFCGLEPLPNKPGVVYIPYTETAACFFATAMMNLAAMALRLDEFFSKPETLALAIEQQATLNMTPQL